MGIDGFKTTRFRALDLYYIVANQWQRRGDGTIDPHALPITTLASAAIISKRFTTLRTFFNPISSRRCPIGIPTNGHSYLYSTSEAQRHRSKKTAEADLKPAITSLESLLSSKDATDIQTPQSTTAYEGEVVAAFEARVEKYIDIEKPKDRWRRRHRLGVGGSKPPGSAAVDGKQEVLFKTQHIRVLEPPNDDKNKLQRRLDYVNNNTMKSHVQFITTPTADTPGTTLLLHFDNKRYLIGSLAEGTQRACVQMGARLLKVSECFITGRTEWSNTGGLIGMILTLADAASSSAAASQEDAKKRAHAKAKRQGCLDDPVAMKELEEEATKENKSRLRLFAAPNLNHTLAAGRRFVFRKGMPVDVHEIDENSLKQPGEDEWAPYWADANIKMWPMSILPESDNSAKSQVPVLNGTVSPRKRSFEEMHDQEIPVSNDSTSQRVVADDLTPKQRDLMTVKAVVSEMFDSSWRLDTLHETPLSNVKLPATIFIRNAETNKIEKYTGPLPGANSTLSDPNLTVLVRKPWPGALVESLPPTEPAKEALSYIVRNHTQRGKFNPQNATKLKVEKGRKWAQLSDGQNVENTDGETITPDMVLGESKEGGGLAIVDLPDPSYIKNLLARAEWREPKVMAGVGAVIWICGPDVANDRRVRSFMQEFTHLKHVLSSRDCCPNYIALDSAAAATVRLRQVDPKRYTVPHHGPSSGTAVEPFPENAQVAQRGLVIQLEPSIEVQGKQAVPILDITETEAATSQEVLEEAAKAQEAIKIPSDEIIRWQNSLPSDALNAEVITLGTGSALPSKYRNVSASLLRVPGWGSMLFDCGENTLGQLKRVFSAAELKEVFHELRMIWISHMHADHHLGTAAVVRAWYEEVHDGKPLPAGTISPQTFDTKSGLAVVSETAMQHWLYEYSSVEDFGFSRIAPLFISPAVPHRNIASKLGWFIPPKELASVSNGLERRDRLAANLVTPDLLDLIDMQSVSVKHCHGAMAVSITFPSGFKASYSGDCRPCNAFTQIGKDSTVCIHEATFDDELQGDAEAKNHSTTSEALGIAQGMGAKACVLTHFSQRYQKVPVIERNGEPINPTAEDLAMTDGTDEESANPDVAMNGPLEDLPAATFPDQTTSNGAQGQQYEIPNKRFQADATEPGAPAAVKFKLASDMKVCVAFDYMRVKVGEIPELEMFIPALLKLFAEEEKPATVESGSEKVNGKKQQQQAGKKNGKAGKSQRNN